MKNYITDIKIIIEQARRKAYASIGSVMIEAYWEIGQRIVEEEQKGTERAKYGTELIKNISNELTKDLGRGFSKTSIRDYRKFYLVFPDWKEIAHACAELQWSHIRLIMRVSDKKAANII